MRYQIHYSKCLSEKRKVPTYASDRDFLTLTEPEIRDLFGTAVAENALKGILITTSSFTKQAIEFARGKNLELIDGSALFKLIDSVGGPKSPILTDMQKGFLSDSLFDKDFYLMLVSKIDNNHKLEPPHETLISFQFDSIMKLGKHSLENGLVQECLKRIDTYIELYAKGKRESSRHKRFFMAYKKALLLFIKGEFGNSFELMHNELGIT